MKLLITFTLIFGLQFVVLHALAEFFELYWRYAWLDIPMHVFGGVLLILILNTLVIVKALPERFINLPTLPFVIGGVLILWEIFGVIRFGGFKPNYVMDTSLDLLFGILGAVGGYYLAKALRRFDT
jgi:hypothetical protein